MQSFQLKNTEMLLSNRTNFADDGSANDKRTPSPTLLDTDGGRSTLPEILRNAENPLDITTNESQSMMDPVNFSHKDIQKDVPPRSVYDRINILEDLRTHIRYLYDQQMMSLEYHTGQESLESTKQALQRKPTSKTSHMPAMESMMMKLLGTPPQSDINILGKLQRCAKQEIQQDILTGSGNSVTALRKKLYQSKENHSKRSTIKQQKHQIARVDTYMQSLSKILAFNEPALQYSSDAICGFESPKQRARHFRQAWEQNYRQALQRNIQQLKAIGHWSKNQRA
jgi:hypothetical protein